MRVCQVINALDRADAVSLCVLETDRMLRELGHATEIYYESAHRSVAARGRSVKSLRPEAGDLILFHYAGYSRILGPVSRFAGKRGVIFHNVTPAHFFEGMPETYEFCRRAVEQIPDLPRLFDFGIGDSAFNAQTLTDVGFEHVRVHSIAWETSGLADVEPDPGVRSRWSDGTTNLLMVARVAPHKGIHFAVEAVPEIERALGRPVRLLLVGRTSGYEPYLDRLRAAIRQGGVDDRVVLVGEVSLPELRGFYEIAHVLLQLSEHEGFCMPLVEAMGLDVPIVAARGGAVEETLGEAGVLLEDRSPAAIARGVREALRDGSTSLRDRRRVRAAAFSRPAVRASLERVLAWTKQVPRAVPSPRLPSFSVVVCTCDRAHVLGRCLDALRDLDYPEFEVVVVEGPSTDGTARVLDGFPDVKRVPNPERNLSISRNLGIAASAGEIVAFIDDDAIPDRGWLRALADAYHDPTIGGAGGDVFGPGGDHLQFSFGVLSPSGRVRAVRPPEEADEPKGPWCNTLMGTNASFRRTALEAVGGFDENYEYYHDEADLCARLVQAGHSIVHVPCAVVWHGFEAGTVRRSRFDVDFTVVVKNTIYFAFATNRWRRRPWRLLGSLATVSVHVGWVLKYLALGEIGARRAARQLAGWARGVGQGFRKGLSVAPRRALADRSEARPQGWRSFSRRRSADDRDALHVALVSQQFPPDPCGGIGVYTEQLARGLRERGCRVSVVAEGGAGVDWRDGVEVYRVPTSLARVSLPPGWGTTRKNLARSLGVQQVLSWLVRNRNLRLVETPLWDAEGYAASLAREVPVVLRLNTPMALAAETQGWSRGEDLGLAADLEWSLLRRADAVIDPSGTIVDTIAERFDRRPSSDLVETIPFGTPLPAVRPFAEGDGVRFLFLGRLERRKGIDTLLAAMPRVLAARPEALFDLAGEPPPGQSAEAILADLAPEVRRRVHLHGFVDEPKRADLYASCDVFVAPSRYESFGIVYLEAMAHGRACIAGAAGGPSRIVVPGVTGLLVPPGDSEALAGALLELACDPEKRRAMGIAGRRRVEEEFSVEAMVRRTLALYETVVARWRRQPSSSARSS